MKRINAGDVEMPWYAVRHYEALGISEDGRLCGVLRLLFHWTLHVDIDDLGYRDRYCYRTLPGAMAALDCWNGLAETEPDGWHRHPGSGRRRDPETGMTWYDP